MPIFWKVKGQFIESKDQMKAEEEVLKSHLLSHKRNLHYLLNCHKHWSSLIYNTSARQERHERRECNTSNTNATRMQHECNESATRVRHKVGTSAIQMTRVRNEWKTLILITKWEKKIFHTLIFTIWQVKDDKERNRFILRTNVWKCLVSMPKCV